MNETLDYLKAMARLPVVLRRFARRGPITLNQAQRTVGERLAQRESNFLSILERSVYGWPRSPYLALLRHAGCELGDVQALVQGRGLEAALAELRQSGVYVTFEEFKGRKPIVRPGLMLPVAAGDFDNPAARRDLLVETGGTTGAAMRVAADLDHTYATASYQTLALAAHGLHQAPVIIWRGILPDGAYRSAFNHLCAGRPVRRWFSQIGWRESRYWVKYGLATAYVWFWARAAGLRLPRPEIARLDKAGQVARAVAEVAKAEGRCLVHTGISRAVRLCEAAQASGFDLTGAAMRVSGEAVTPAKARRLEKAGVQLISGYGMTEAGSLAQACAQPADESDMHLFTDAVALIAHPHYVESFDLTVPAFNLTTLLDTAPKLLLNVQLDDYGIVEERACGCALEAYGYTTHLRQIRSYSKLTGEGVTLIGNELLRVLEDVLPARFGGGPLDYQLVEEEADDGLTRLCLMIHPSIQIRDEAEVVAAVLDGLSRSSPMADAARMIWQGAGTIQIKRAAPVWTGRGKFLPLLARSRVQASPKRTL